MASEIIVATKWPSVNIESTVNYYYFNEHFNIENLDVNLIRLIFNFSVSTFPTVAIPDFQVQKEWRPVAETRGEGRFFRKNVSLGKQRLFRYETIAIYFSPDVKNAVGRGQEKIYTRIKLPRDFVTRKAAFSGWSGTTRRVFRCKSAAARCPGEHRNQDRKLVYTWRRRRQMVVTYDGVDLLSFSLFFSFLRLFV